MGDGADDKPVVIAIEVDDPALAGRLVCLLADLPGIRLAVQGERAAASLVGPDDFDGPARLDQPLTPREVEVLTLLADGASNKTIARQLGISVHTAKFHVGQLLHKLDATGRTDAVAHAARLGVLHL